jgi:hypothetical protein
MERVRAISGGRRMIGTRTKMEAKAELKAVTAGARMLI